MKPFAQFVERIQMIGNESARGTEFQAFGGSNPNHHLAIY
jgi:hypothetical protein